MGDNRVFKLEEWTSFQDLPGSPSDNSTPKTSSSFSPFGRRRKGSVPLFELPFVISNLNIGGSSNPGENDLKQKGGLRGLFRRASTSIRNRQRRHSHAVESHSQMRPQTAWGRLKTAASFQRNSRSFLSSEDDESAIDTQAEHALPIPGTATEPPIIPFGSGGAARATAAYQNEFLGLGQRNKKYEKLAPREQLGDRESGIGISAISDLSDDSYDDVDDIPRIDFVEQLPAELTIQIFSLLDLKTLSSAMQVSSSWQIMLDSPPIWRDVFLREMSKTYAMSTPPALGAGLGLPAFEPAIDWKELYQVRQKLHRNWMEGHAEPRYLVGHLDSIYCVQFDEHKIITGSRDRTIRVWDMKTYACKLVIGSGSVVDQPDILERPDGQPQHFVTTPENRRVSDSRPEILSYNDCHSQSILCLQYDEDILVTGSSDSTCIVYDIKNTYRPIRRLRHHTAAVLDLAFDKDYIVTCSKDVSICIWDRHTGQMLKQLRGHSGPVNAVQLRGNTVVSCSGDFKVKLWNIDTGKNIREFVGHTKGLACSQFSDDSRFIASAGNDRTIRIWDANTGDCLQAIEAHDNLVRSLHIDSISGRLISGSYDQDIKVFDMKTGRILLDFPRWHASWVLGAKSDYRRIISTGQDAKILVMDFGAEIPGIEKLESVRYD